MAAHLASFSSQVRGIKFYDFSSTSVCVGTNLEFRLESGNSRDENCVAAWTRTTPRAMLGHLARETACLLAPLLCRGLTASGSVTSAPYSRSKTSRWHGFRVCDVRIVVEGPRYKLQDVQKALGRLKGFTVSCYEDNDSSYEDSDSDNDNVDKNTNTYILVDSDTDSDSTIPLSDTTNILTPPLKQKPDSDSDATPLKTPPSGTYMYNTAIRPTVPLLKRERDSDSDTTPTVTPPLTKTVTIVHRRPPKRLFCSDACQEI